MHSAQIVSLLSSVLTDILNSFEIRMPKMTTKNAKIRKLLSLQEISDTCTQEEVDKIEAMLIAQEQKRNSKKEAELDEDPKDDDQDIYGASHVLSGFPLLSSESPVQDGFCWEELNDDAATMACKELLKGLGDEDGDNFASEDEQAENPDGMDETCTSSHNSVGYHFSGLSINQLVNYISCFCDLNTQEAQNEVDNAAKKEASVRASRSLLSNTETVPAQLLERFPIPPGCVIHHTVHKDTTLPHFQGRVVGGLCFQGK